MISTFVIITLVALISFTIGMWFGYNIGFNDGRTTEARAGIRILEGRA